MSLKDEILRVLDNRSIVDRINFSLGNLHIRKSGFRRIRAAISSNLIKVGVSRMPNAAAAEYIAENNRLNISRNGARRGNFDRHSFQAVIVHECVHAIVDASRSGRTTVLADESAAYIAQCLYRLRSVDARSFRNWLSAFPNTEDARLLSAAVDVIDRFNLLHRSQTIAWNDYRDLRSAINAHSLYSDISPSALTRANGLN